jgi:hypothetical protein
MKRHPTKKLAKFAIQCLFALMLVGALSTPSGAQEQSETQKTSSLSTTDAPADVKEDRWPWRFRVNGYGWMPRAPVDIEVDDNDVANYPEGFDNIFDSLEFAAMFEVEAYKGPIGAFVSPIYYEGKDTERFTGLAGERRKATLKEKVWLIKYGVSYDLGPWRLGKTSDSPTVVLQPYVGGLYLHDDITLQTNKGLLDEGLDFKTTIEINTPIVGLNTLWDLTKRWNLRLGANYGGWDVDDMKKTYEFIGTVGFNFKMWNVSSHVFAGYRYVHIDYKKKNVELKVDIEGPLVGIGWEF